MIAAARATGPAYKAGLRAGDKIVEAAGSPVARGASSSIGLGRSMPATRCRSWPCAATSRSTVEVELADKIEPYESPFLGVLPMRFVNGAADPGLVVRYVYPDSPAAAAGIQPGDRITTMAGKASPAPRRLPKSC